MFLKLIAGAILWLVGGLLVNLAYILWVDD